MEIIHWSKEFSVGIRFIDEQHLNIIEIINMLILGNERGITSDDVDKALERMLAYTKIHFEEEEKLMVQYQYPELENQKKSHQEFIAKKSLLFNDFRSKKECNPLEMIEYLRSWWIHHILEEDMQYKDFFQKAGVG